MKKHLSELAIFGGLPSFKEKLHVGRPNIGSKKVLLQRINDILDNKWLTNNGQFVQAFEQHIASLVGVKHCIATCSEHILPLLGFTKTNQGSSWVVAATYIIYERIYGI